MNYIPGKNFPESVRFVKFATFSYEKRRLEYQIPKKQDCIKCKIGLEYIIIDISKYISE